MHSRTHTHTHTHLHTYTRTGPERPGRPFPDQVWHLSHPEVAKDRQQPYCSCMWGNDRSQVCMQCLHYCCQLWPCCCDMRNKSTPALLSSLTFLMMHCIKQRILSTGRGLQKPTRTILGIFRVRGYARGRGEGGVQIKRVSLDCIFCHYLSFKINSLIRFALLLCSPQGQGAFHHCIQLNFALQDRGDPGKRHWHRGRSV